MTMFSVNSQILKLLKQKGKVYLKKTYFPVCQTEQKQTEKRNSYISVIPHKWSIPHH